MIALIYCINHGTFPVLYYVFPLKNAKLLLFLETIFFIFKFKKYIHYCFVCALTVKRY